MRLIQSKLTAQRMHGLVPQPVLHGTLITLLKRQQYRKP